MTVFELVKTDMLSAVKLFGGAYRALDSEFPTMTTRQQMAAIDHMDVDMEGGVAHLLVPGRGLIVLRYETESETWFIDDDRSYFLEPAVSP